MFEENLGPGLHGMEPETARLAQDILSEYAGVFVELGRGMPTLEEVNDLAGELEQSNKQLWLLANRDLEYFYLLFQKDGLEKACPLCYMGEVEKIVNQQYPLFGYERFSHLLDKAAHIFLLTVKSGLFAGYTTRVGLMATLVLLGRNGVRIHLDGDRLRTLTERVQYLAATTADGDRDGENLAVRQLGDMLRISIHIKE